MKTTSPEAKELKKLVDDHAGAVFQEACGVQCAIGDIDFKLSQKNLVKVVAHCSTVFRGGLEGASWTEGLEDDATWEMITAHANKTILDKKLKVGKNVHEASEKVKKARAVSTI